jgi:hypothetical protein
MVEIGGQRKGPVDITGLTVTCADPTATGKAAKGTYNNDGATIVAKIEWDIKGPASAQKIPELELLQKVCTIKGKVNGKDITKKYKVTKWGAGTTTFTRQ